MAVNLPRGIAEELDTLVEQLGKPDAKLREKATVRLLEHERAGRVPLAALLEFSESDNPSLSMYAISALGRNGEPKAVTRLVEMVERNRDGNALYLEQIIDALGDTHSTDAAGVLLGLLGIRTGWGSKLFGRRGRKEEDEAAQARFRERVTLPVLRALEKIADPKAAQALGAGYLSHQDPLVRWHAVQILLHCNLGDHNAKLREMAEQDADDLVREAASIAIERLEPLPPRMNN